MKRGIRVGFVALVLLASVVSFPAVTAAPICDESQPLCYQVASEDLLSTLEKIKEPNIAVPYWLGASQ